MLFIREPLVPVLGKAAALLVANIALSLTLLLIPAVIKLWKGFSDEMRKRGFSAFMGKDLRSEDDGTKTKAIKTFTSQTNANTPAYKIVRGEGLAALTKTEGVLPATGRRESSSKWFMFGHEFEYAKRRAPQLVLPDASVDVSVTAERITQYPPSFGSGDTATHTPSFGDGAESIDARRKAYADRFNFMEPMYTDGYLETSLAEYNAMAAMVNRVRLIASGEGGSTKVVITVPVEELYKNQTRYVSLQQFRDISTKRLLADLKATPTFIAAVKTAVPAHLEQSRSMGSSH